MNINNNDNLNREELQKFADLLDKYLIDALTAEEKQAVEQWYESLSGEHETTSSEELESKAKMWKDLQEQTASKNDVKKLKLFDYSMLKLAASVLLVCAIGFFAQTYFTNNDKQLSSASTSNTDGWVVKNNTTDQVYDIVLPDKSIISLSSGSTVKYPAAFEADQRTVHFNGKGFFDIQRDPARPFKVITGNIATRVLGTSFTVLADSKSQVVEVIVRTGKVSVYEYNQQSDESGEGVILTPNQKVTYYRDDDKWVTELVADPIPVEKEDERNMLVFKDQLVKDVLADLSEIYGIEIIVSNDHIYDCTFTGDVSKMDMFDILKVLCKSIRATYEIKGTRILINGDGCSIR